MAAAPGTAARPCARAPPEAAGGVAEALPGTELPVPARRMASAVIALLPWAEADGALAVRDAGAGEDAGAVAEAALAFDRDEKLFAAAAAADMSGVVDAPCPRASPELLPAALPSFAAPGALPSDAVAESAAMLRARFLPAASVMASPAVVVAGAGAAPGDACTIAAPDMASTSGDGAVAGTGLPWPPDLLAGAAAAEAGEGGGEGSAETAGRLGGAPRVVDTDARRADVSVMPRLSLPSGFAALADDDAVLLFAATGNAAAGAGSAGAVASALASVSVDAEELTPLALTASATYGLVASPAAWDAALGATLRGAVAAASAAAGAATAAALPAGTWLGSGAGAWAAMAARCRWDAKGSPALAAGPDAWLSTGRALAAGTDARTAAAAKRAHPKGFAEEAKQEPDQLVAARKCRRYSVSMPGIHDPGGRSCRPDRQSLPPSDRPRRGSG